MYRALYAIVLLGLLLPFDVPFDFCLFDFCSSHFFYPGSDRPAGWSHRCLSNVWSWRPNSLKIFQMYGIPNISISFILCVSNKNSLDSILKHCHYGNLRTVSRIWCSLNIENSNTFSVVQWLDFLFLWFIRVKKCIRTMSVLFKGGCHKFTWAPAFHFWSRFLCASMYICFLWCLQYISVAYIDIWWHCFCRYFIDVLIFFHEMFLWSLLCSLLFLYPNLSL